MAQFDADVVIVGSGALGSLCAAEIAAAGKSVIILEAGPRTPDWKITENFRVSPRKDNLNDPFGSLAYAPNSWTPGYVKADIDLDMLPGTLRTVGGSSRHWAAISWRLLPEEMKLKSTFGVGQDWPIDYAELEAFYTEAEYRTGVNGVNGGDESGRGGNAYPPRSKTYPLPPEAKPYALQRFHMRVAERGYTLQHAPNSRISKPWAGRPQCIGNNICNPNCPIGAKYSGWRAAELAEGAGAQLRTGAVVDRLETDRRGRITALSYLSPHGVRTRLTARAYVIAGHGFETPKLLLMNGLAKRSGMVGRNLMMHPTLPMAFYADEPVWMGRGQAVHGALLQRRLQPDRGAVASAFYQFINNNPAAEVAAELLKEGKLIGPDFDREHVRRTSRLISMQVLLEDLPDPANAISLNSSWKDALGLPGLHVRYRVGAYTKRALPRAQYDFANWVQAMNGEIQSAPGKWSVQHHIMGTVMMGTDPQTSVVDRDLRCHDHDNLYLVTTGVFPSVSSINPTLTGMALALRAGQHIARAA